MTLTKLAKNVVKVQVNSGSYWATPTGVKVAAKGKVLDAGMVYSSLSKGDARKLRKALRAAGKPALAGARRDARAFEQAVERMYDRYANGAV